MRSPVPSAKKEDLIAAFLPPCKTGSLAEEVLSAMLKSDGVAVKSYGQCLPNQVGQAGPALSMHEQPRTCDANPRPRVEWNRAEI